MGRKWTAAIVLLAAIAGVGWMAHALTREESHRTMRRGAAATVEPRATRRATSESLRRREGYAEVVEPESDAAAHTAEPESRFWYGYAIDARTRLGEPGVAIEIQQVGEQRTWPGGRTLEEGVFVVRAPDDLTGEESLRLSFAAHDGRRGLRAVKALTEPSLRVGRVLLRGVEKLSGRCVDTRGHAVADVRLALRAVDDSGVEPDVVAAGETNEDGYFEFERIPRGMYVLEGRGNDAKLFLLAPLAVPHPEFLVLHPVPVATMALAVHNSLGQAVEGAQVRAKLSGPPATDDPLGNQHLLPPVSGSTDHLGIVHLTGLLHGSYQVGIEIADNGFRFVVDLTADSAGGRPTILTIPTDPRVVLRCILPDGRPAVRMPLQVADGSRFPDVVTDTDGLFRLPRGKPPTFVRSISAQRGGLVGSVSLPHEKLAEGIVSAEVHLRHADARTPQQPRTDDRTDRIATVHTPDGLPVSGARFLGGSRAARSGKDGRAAVGAMGRDDVLRLVRHDLASGHASSGKVGALEEIAFVWRRGREVTLHVTDATFGFPLDQGVRIGVNASAWKRVGPGRFTARWDPDGVDPPDAKIIVHARDYAPLQFEPPRTDGLPIEIEARMRRPSAPNTATVSLQVFKRNAPKLGARVSGVWTDRARDVKGRARFRALSGPDGRIVVPDLKPGRWRFIAQAEFDGWGRKELVLARGSQELVLDMTHKPSHVGVVVDQDGHGIEDALIEISGGRNEITRTRKDGRFALNSVRGYGPALKVNASKAGYSPRSVIYTLKDGSWERPVIRLLRTADLALPLRWRDRSGQEPPTDLRFDVYRRVKRTYMRLAVHPVVVDGVLVASNVPTGRILMRQTAGSAYVGSVRFTLKEGGTHRRPAVSMFRGVTVQGSVRGPHADGTLVTVRSGNHPPRTTRANDQGAFELHGIPPGSIRVEAVAQTAASRRRNAALNGRNGRVLDVTVDR